MIPQEKEGPPTPDATGPLLCRPPGLFTWATGIALRLWHEVEGNCLKDTMPSEVLSSWHGA